MAQFDVYAHPMEELRVHYPYVVQIQSDHIEQAHMRMVIPLALLDKNASTTSRLTPLIEVFGDNYVLETLMIESFTPSELRMVLVSIRNQSQEIYDAMDFVLHGY